MHVPKKKKDQELHVPKPADQADGYDFDLSDDEDE